MKFRLLCLLMLYLVTNAHGQDYQVKFTSRLAARKMIYLGSFYGERINPIDSALADDKGFVKFSLGSRRAPGMFRLALNQQMFTDFIFNHEDVEIRIDQDDIEDGIKIVSSSENKLYYSFLKEDRNLKKKISLLLPLLDEYPRNDPFYQKILKQAQEIQDDYQTNVANILKNYPASFAARLIGIRVQRPVNFKFSAAERKSELKLRYFEGLNFSDSSLLRSTAYPSKLIEYLGLYANPEFSQPQLEKEFTKAIDMIFSKVQMSKAIYDYSLSYLVGGFEKFKFENVLVHIQEKYLSGLLCDEDKTQKDLAFRLEAFKKMAIGKQVPDMILKMPDGSLSSIDNLKSEYCLIVFWAAWCPHCIKMLPELDKISSLAPAGKIQIIAVSLDTTDIKLNEITGGFKGSLISQCDFKGWNSPWVKDYNVYATPTMFLVDRNRVIVAKPITLYDLADAFAEKGIKIQ